MPKNNLAYESEREYADIPDSPLLKKDVNKRTAGGVMIKLSKNKRIKVKSANTKPAKAKAHITRNGVFSVILITSMAFLVLFRGLMIQSEHDKLEERKTELEAILAENQKIQFKIDQTLDLKNVENIAKNTYNMGEPTKAQIVYINLDQNEEVTKVSGNKSFADGIADFFGEIVEYFS
jgi:hypothetical protein